MAFDTESQSGLLADTTPPRLKILLAYDSPDHAGRAMKLVNKLAADFGPELELHCDLWRFDILALLGAGKPPREACQASLMIVAADGEREMSAPVKDWLRNWVAESHPDGAALVALLATGPGAAPQSSPVHDFLQALATEGEIEFFAREFNAAACDESDPPVLEGIPRRAEPAFPVVPASAAHSLREERIPSPPLAPVAKRNPSSSRWGLNE